VDRQGGRSRLLIVEYTDPPAAVRAGRSFARAFMPDAPGGSAVKTENGLWTVLRVHDRIAARRFRRGDQGGRGPP
jgi:hypothetical protein